MQNNDNLTDWKEALSEYPSIITKEFIVHWNSRPRCPTTEDAKAAAELHIQLISRIATQSLPYLAGVEATALKSIYDLFGHARGIGSKYPLAIEFDDIVWYVLNTFVRPFTAKWHRKNQDGVLDALDETDQFRSELSRLQEKLVVFDSLLLLLRDGKSQQRFQGSGISSDVADEMDRSLDFGIPTTLGGVSLDASNKMNDAEKKAITARRKTYQIADTTEATGLAISGGGIRSATFALGVLVALSKKNLLPQFDYMSTVSGGGFVGSFLTTFLSGESEEVGLKNCQHPFNLSVGESPALRRIRHNSRYLQTSTWERFSLVVAQVYGMAVNIFAISLLPLLMALGEYFVRSSDFALQKSGQTNIVLTLVLIAGLVVPGLVHRIPKFRTSTDRIYSVLGILMVLIVAWWLLTFAHMCMKQFDERPISWRTLGSLAAMGVVPLLCTLMFSTIATHHKFLRKALALVAGLGAPLSFLGIELVAFAWLESDSRTTKIYLWQFHANSLLLASGCALIYLLVWKPLDINFTSPHRHYRRKLAKAFIIQLDKKGDINPVDIKLSAAKSSNRGPYHLINAALNVPSSDNSAMQGRLTDFFVFSEAFCGSPITGYHPTSSWENADPSLSLATAMAISGAAASPLMGIETKSHVAFWMAILNVRLGYWLKNPGSSNCQTKPGPVQLGQEMLGKIDERGPFFNLTDGGHIENLGVYELLRRRCKFIVAIDGEFDPNMTFHAITNLQRLALIDFGVIIEIDLDELRLDEKQLSRSHFKLCRIRYPASEGQSDGIGYLLYIKLSLTGNEGEFIRRYKMDEPEFPHHSTANQFFSEAQFEAYRSLGEHIGDKLFIQALSGNIGDNPKLSDWFKELGQRMLDGTA